MRLPLALLALAIALAPLPLAVAGGPRTVVARPVPLDARDPSHVVDGKLRYLGGWVLRGSDRRFGGISSMTIERGRFVLLSDTGVVTRFRFRGTGPVADYDLHELPDGPGTGQHKVDRDSESSTYDPASGHVWAGFETTNEIWRYTAGFGPADGHVAPAAMADWPLNQGAEAMVRLRDGRFIVFAETKTNADGSHVALLFPADPVTGAKPVAFGYRGPPGFAVTDAAQLPDGRVLVLHRHFGLPQGFTAAVSLFDPSAIRPGATVAGKTLATLAPPLTVDNMEALAIEQEHGQTIVWMASDDNFLVFQRTLFLKFALEPGA